MAHGVKKTQEESALLNGNFLDLLIEWLKLKNDAALAKIMEVSPPVISKLRHGSLPFGDTYVIKAHELTGKSIREIKLLLGKKSLKSLVSAS